jgi:hypothetical protein
MPATVVKVTLCRLSGRLATERCPLPVIEPAEYDLDHPEVLPGSVFERDGGVYEELRSAGTLPEVCTLPHGESNGAVPAGHHPLLPERPPR